MAKRKLDEVVDNDLQTIKQAKILHNCLSEDILKYDFMVSLKNIAMASTIINLWMEKDIVDVLDNKCIQIPNDKKEQIINNIILKVSILPLPNSIIKELKKLIPIFGNPLFDWIEYHNAHIFQTNVYSAVDYINDIKWTIRGKIDYKLTARYILENEDISDEQKYILACVYCLEDEIAILTPKVLDYFLDNIYCVKNPMVYFWTEKMKDDTKPSETYRTLFNNERRKNGLILKLLIDGTQKYNEVPIRYIWNKSTGRQKTNLAASVIKRTNNQDFRISLLSSLNYEQQQEIFKKCSYYILAGMLDGWLWEKYFLSTALNILDIMKPSSYVKLLNLLINKIKNSRNESCCTYNEKYIFKELWKNGPKQFRSFFLEYDKGYLLEHHVTFSLSWGRDIDIIKLLLNDLNAERKKNIIIGSNGLYLCALFIEHNRWNLLKVLIEHTIFSENDLKELKSELIKTKGYSIIERLMNAENPWDIAEYFMKWAFYSDEEKSQFKASLIYMILHPNLPPILENDKVNFNYLECRIKWYSSNNPITIKKLKTELPKIFFNDIITKLILHDQYVVLDDFLNWCFLANQNQLGSFKSNMYKDEDMQCYIEDLIFELADQDISFESLNKFIDWSFSSSQEKLEFKEWIIHYQKNDDDWKGIINWLSKRQFKLADEFLKWSIISHEEITELKEIIPFLNFHFFRFVVKSQDD